MITPQELPDFRFLQAVDQSQIAEARALEFEIFRESGYTKRAVNGEIEEYLPYSEHSIFFVAVSAAGEMVGVLREIRPSAAGFQTLNDFRLRGRWRSAVPSLVAETAVVEVGTIAIRKDFRGTHGFAVSMGLYRELFRDLIGSGVKYVFASLDERLHRRFGTVFQWPCHTIGYRRFYMGSITVPVLFDVDEWMRAVRGNTPALWSYFRPET